MKQLLWMSVFSTCVLCFTVEAVILREYREKDIMQKSLMRNQTASGHSGGEAAVKKKPFTPDTTRCCSMGRKVAKRRLSCEVKVLDFLHHFNSARQRYNRPQDIKPSKMSFKMSSKVKKCTSSPNLSRHFKKCCVYQKQYFRNMKKCKKQPPEERRRCRKSIRERYS